MKTTGLLAVALVTVTSLPLGAQQASTTTQQNTTVNAPGSHVDESSNAAASASRSRNGAAQLNGTAGESASAQEEMRPVNAELVGKLDSKSTKTGDQVVLKTTQSVRTVDGTEIPKGTRLVGHVTTVQAHGKGSESSQMAIQFDRAEFKGGQSVAIHSAIQTVTPPASAVMASSAESEDSLGGGLGGSRSIGGGAVAVRSGGGLLGGGGAVGGLASSTGHTITGAGAIADDSAHATGHVAGQAVASVGGSSDLAVRAGGGATAHVTGIHGVMLAGDASGSTSGTLSAAKQNVHLESGTQVVLGVVAVK